MVTLSWLVHELVLRHGSGTLEFNTSRVSRKHGTVIECPCGKRWLGRAARGSVDRPESH